MGHAPPTDKKYVDRETGVKKMGSKYYAGVSRSIISSLCLEAAMKWIQHQQQMKGGRGNGRYILANEDVLIITEDDGLVEMIGRGRTPAGNNNLDLYNRIKILKNNNMYIGALKRNNNKDRTVNNFQHNNPAFEIANMCSKTTNSFYNVAGDDNKNNNNSINKFFGDPLHSTTTRNNKKKDDKEELDKMMEEIKQQEEFFSIKQWIGCIQTKQDVIKVSRHKTLREVPPGMKEEWASLVKSIITKIIEAETIEQRSEYLITLIFLPHMFLPLRSSTTKIISHIKKLTPFKIDIGRKQSDGNHQEKQQNDRQSKHVEMLVQNNQIKKCVKHIAQNADIDEDQQQPSFEQKVETLKTKFPSRQPENNFETINNKYIAAIEAYLIMKTLKGTSKQAATSLDGWTRDLLMAAVTIDESILQQLGVIIQSLRV
jgi:uncharacterized protein YifE (UPF0438 family)